MMYHEVAFEQLPADVQAEAKETLKAFRSVHVEYENGRYSVTAGIALTATYAPDHRYIGEYTDEEVFTPEERIINYVETFQCYPIEYKGRRDYRWIKTLTRRSKVAFDDAGNLVTA